MNENVLNEMVVALCRELARVHVTQPYREEDMHHIDTEGNYSSDSSPAGELARGWCHKLLKAAKGNSMYGCPLCRS